MNFDLPTSPADESNDAWKLWVLDEMAEDPLNAPLLTHLRSLFHTSAQRIAQEFPLPEGVHGHVLLGGDQSAMDWGVNEDALGFHAVLARVTDEDSNEEYLDLPADHRCYVNLDGLIRAMRNDQDDEATWEAALVTLPHEMAHVALFARFTQGATPLQVFDEQGGEVGLGAVLEGMDDDAALRGHAGSHGAGEDEVEAWGNQVVSDWTPGHFPSISPKRQRRKP